ncbi:super-infection exclusion protein B [Acinetobacter baumannii]|uniref:super-infection exclusion protein B n=1 Tax=Acinetobacter baumannii TaxID=470 RepID=UPI00338E2D3D
MEKLINSVLDIFRTHNILLYGVLFVSGVLTYNFAGLSDVTGYLNIDVKYRNYVALAFLFSAIIVFLLVIKSIFLFFKNYIVEKEDKINTEALIQEKLANLTRKEHAVLMQFFIQNSETIWLPLRAQEIVELMNARIITLASNAARMTWVGEAAMLKLPKNTMQKLTEVHPQLYSAQYDRNLVKDILENHTPESVRVVKESQSLYGY